MNLQRDAIDGANLAGGAAKQALARRKYFREILDFNQRHKWILASSAGCSYAAADTRLFAHLEDYNYAMSAQVPAEPTKNHDADRTHHTRRLETLGLIAIALLILAITIARSWHNINWSAH